MNPRIRETDVHDARIGRIEGVAELGFLAVENDRSFEAAGFMDHRHAEENLHECRFSGTVLPDEADDFALPLASKETLWPTPGCHRTPCRCRVDSEWVLPIALMSFAGIKPHRHGSR